MKSAAVGEEASAPLGATVCPGGVNSSVFSKNATGMDLALFDDPHRGDPNHVCEQRSRDWSMCATPGPLHDGIGRRAVKSARAVRRTNTIVQ